MLEAPFDATSAVHSGGPSGKQAAGSAGGDGASTKSAMKSAVSCTVRLCRARVALVGSAR